MVFLLDHIIDNFIYYRRIGAGMGETAQSLVSVQGHAEKKVHRPVKRIIGQQVSYPHL